MLLAHLFEIGITLARFPLSWAIPAVNTWFVNKVKYLAIAGSTILSCNFVKKLTAHFVGRLLIIIFKSISFDMVKCKNTLYYFITKTFIFNIVLYLINH